MYLQGSEQCPWMHLHDVGTEAFFSLADTTTLYVFVFFFLLQKQTKTPKQTRNITGNIANNNICYRQHRFY